MERLLWVCAGGAVGSGARWLVAGWVQRALGPSFPYGTLVVNVAGSFALAALMYLGASRDLVPPLARLAVSAGVLGGFTTYSTFNYETMQYLEEGAWVLAGLNLFATVAGCLVAGLAGLAMARWIAGG